MEKIKYKRGVVIEGDQIEREKIKIDKSRMGKVEDATGNFKFRGETINLDVRALGTFEKKAIYLVQSLDWIICKDEKGSICLVPLEKETL